MEKQFTDYHCHLLPALDDGATDVEESVAMARILADFGFIAVHCTPHRITGCFDNDPARVELATRALQRVIDDHGIRLRLIPGTEHYLDEFLIDQVPQALRTESRYLLVEVPFRSGPDMIPVMVTGLLQRGLSPLFAHPERCRAFDPVEKNGGVRAAFSSIFGRQRQPELEDDALVFRLKARGCRFQGNLGSFAGRYGSDVKQRAILFLRHGVYSCLGSDAHRSDDLAAILSAAYSVVAAEVGEDAATRLLSGAALRGED